MNNFNVQLSLSTEDPISASYLNPGLYSVTASLAVSSSNTIPTKAGTLSGSIFGGMPRTASISFDTAWPRRRAYSVVVTGEEPRFYTVTSQSMDGFIISANNDTSLDGKVSWQAVMVGEFNNNLPQSVGLLTWHKPETLALSDGQSVSLWIDSSGNGYHLTQSIGGSQPLYKLNRINGVSGVMFDGVDDTLDWPVELLDKLDSTGECEMFIVARKFSQTDSTGLYNIGGDDAGYCLHCYSNGAIIECFADSETAGLDGSPASGILTTPFIWNNRTDGTIQTVEISGSFDTSISTVELTSYKFTTAYRSLGYGGRADFLDSYASCSICEVMIYGHQLSTADRSVVKEYLKVKYSINP